MCQAPQLLGCPLSLDLVAHLPTGTLARLGEWERQRQLCPPALLEPANPRLGLYFERLYECLLTELLGWQLLAKNVQIRGATGRTLGELDFVVRNPFTGQVEHHEVAVKFYLGYRSEHDEVLWYGPNTRDRLDLKTRRLLEHQSTLSQLPETLAALESLGIREPVTPRIFMPGYLFHPPGPSLELPDTVPEHHLRGQWQFQREGIAEDTRLWVPLNKPDWLGPWSQESEPDAGEAEAVLTDVATHGRPWLFARLVRDDRAGLWVEADRLFVVPDGWPGRNSSSS